MSRLRINWILPAANMAGGTKSNRLIAEAMVRRGHDVCIAYPDVPVAWPSLRHPRAVLRRCWRGWLTRSKQRHHLEESTATLLPVLYLPVRANDVPDADVTIATWWQTMEWIRDWPSSKGIKAYFIRHYELHGGDPERVKATYHLPVQKLVIARWLQRLMREEFADPNAILVPNGVDWNQFNSTPRGKAAIPTVGMLYGRQPWKGCDTAFAALLRVQQQLANLRVIVFGSAPLGRHTRLPANLEYHLRPAQNVIPKLYRSSDCWLVCSTSEGFGMPGLEAAACRCPIVSTRCGGPEDYVEDGISGRLVPVGDERAMADATLDILRLDEPAWRKMSEASYSIARRFDWDRSAEILEATLVRIVERARVEGTAAAAAAT